MIGVRRALLSGAMLFVAMASSLGFAAATSLPASAATTGGACEAVAPNYEGSAVVTVDKTQVTPGETLTLTGKGFPPGAEVQILVNGKVVGTATADSDGGFTFSYLVPGDTAAGPITISASCDPLVSNQSVEVLGESVGSLPKTGSNLWPEVKIAGALILVGGVLVIAVRKRHTATV